MRRIPLEEAIELLKINMKTHPDTEVISLKDALNRQNADDIYAVIHVPSFNRSAMDGYAVKSDETSNASNETPKHLKVIGEVLAGDATQVKGTTNSNTCVRIMTGAAIPTGYDAVIRQEDTDEGMDTVQLYATVKPFQNYSMIGEDIKKNQLLLKANSVLTPLHLGILASQGIQNARVIKKMKVGIISTGSELQAPNKTLAYGQIYDSNQTVLAARLLELNVDVVFQTVIQDEIEDVSDVITQNIDDVDLILTTGGVSVGKKDILHDVLTNLGAKRLFWQLAMRPGTPALASVYRGKLILSLSGNPFASLTTFELLFRPILGTYLSRHDVKMKQLQAKLCGTTLNKSVQRRFIRAYYEDGVVRIPTTEHASSVLFSMIGCNCFIDLQANSKVMVEGDEVSVHII